MRRKTGVHLTRRIGRLRVKTHRWRKHGRASGLHLITDIATVTNGRRVCALGASAMDGPLNRVRFVPKRTVPVWVLREKKTTAYARPTEPRPASGASTPVIPFIRRRYLCQLARLSCSRRCSGPNPRLHVLAHPDERGRASRTIDFECRFLTCLWVLSDLTTASGSE